MMRKNILLYLPVKALCIAAILLLCMTESGLSAQSPFVVKYTFASGSSDVQFYVQTDTGGTQYTYQILNASNALIGTGSGSIPQMAYGLKAITLSPSVPAGGSVVLSLGPANLLRYGNNNNISNTANVYNAALSDVVQWGTAAWNSTAYMFQNCTGLTDLSATDVPNMSTVTDMSFMFYLANQLKTIPGIGSWNTSKVTSMRSMFYGASAFNGNIGSWNTSIVTDMSSMFLNAYAFNGNIGSWNTSNVNNMSYMFNSATIFNQDISYKPGAGAQGPADSDAWNTSKVKDMSYMFDSATAFNQNIGNWNTSGVNGSSSLTGGMKHMFYNATVFNQNIGSWNTSGVTDMSWMFGYASAFNQNIGNWNTSNVKDMSYMFYNASVFNQDISYKPGQGIGPVGSDAWNTSQVTLMNNMFQNAAVFNGDISNWNTINVTDMSSMFSGPITGTVFNRNIGNWNTSNVTNMRFMFSNATAFNQDISYKPGSNAWNTSKVTNMSGMFSGATAFNQNIGNWNTSNVTNMSSMFQGATVFNQDISYKQGAGAPGPADSNAWNTSAVTTMVGMFRDATAFNQNIGNWNTSKVTNMIQMFQNATAFNQDISYKPGAGAPGQANSDAWNVSNVTNANSGGMTLMFSGATAFNRNIGSWKFNTGLTSMGSMLDNSGLDCANYSRTLQGWAANNTTAASGRGLGAAGMVYNSQDTPTAAARSQLVTKGWTITGDSATGSCVTDKPFIVKYTFPATAVTSTPPDPGTGSSDVQFYVQTSGSTPYSYQIFNASNTQIGTGSGSFTQTAYASKTITLSQSVPPGGSLVLSLGSANLLRYGNANSSIDVPNKYNGALRDVVQWGSATWSSTAYMFQNCVNLITMSAQDIPDLSNVQNMSCMFQDTWNLTTVPNINSWNTSAVTDMSHMFQDAHTFNQDIGNWNTSNVTDMQVMFCASTGAFSGGSIIIGSIFNQDIGKWNTSNVTNMAGMFYHADHFNQDLSYKQGAGPGGTDAWDTSKVTDMSEMFLDTPVFNGDINNWNTSNVTSMSQMFSCPIAGTTAFNQDISYKPGQGPRGTDAWDTSKVTTMDDMFDRTTAFNGNIGNWKTSNVTSMGFMFQNATGFNQNIGNWDTSKVTYMRGMFAFASAFNQDLSYKQGAGPGGTDAWDTSKVTDMGGMFAFASAFNRNIGSWTLNAAVDMTTMLNASGIDCTNYSRTLQGWAAGNPTVIGRTLGAAGMVYNPLDAPTATARNKLTNPSGMNWAISGDSATGSCLTTYLLPVNPNIRIKMR